MPSSSASLRGRLLVGAAIIMLSLNLRVAVTSVGVVLESLQNDLGLGGTEAGLLTTLPLLCFAIFGLATAPIIRRFGLHRTTMVALLAMAVGLGLRVVGDSALVFFAMSFLALAAAAVGNVALPPLVTTHFPDRVALMSSLYGAGIMASAAAGSILSVPVVETTGSWRWSLGVWALLAVVTIIPWLGLIRHDAAVAVRQGIPLDVAAVVRRPLTWAMAGCFGAQAGGAYTQFGWFPQMLVDGGLSRASAGIMLSLLVAVGIPATLALPWCIRRWGDRSVVLPIIFGSATVSGWVGVLLAPATAPWLWAILLGLGGTAFTWVLAMIGFRTRTAEGTVALSALTQGPGYLFGAAMPFLTGFLHDASGSWTTPIVILVATGAIITASGIVVARSAPLEVTLARDRRT